MIQEIMDEKINISYSESEIGGHYQVTPYSFSPNMARKIVSDSFIDLGQGLVGCMQAIHEELNGKS